MNVIDIIIIAIAVGCIGFGLLRGITSAVISLNSLLVAGWLTIGLFDLARNTIQPVSDSAMMHDIIAFVVTLVCTIVAVCLIKLIINHVLGSSKGLGMRLVGAAIGSGYAALWVLTLLLLAAITSLPKQTIWSNSTLIPYFQPTAVWLRDHYISGSFAQHIRFNTIEDLTRPVGQAFDDTRDALTN